MKFWCEVDFKCFDFLDGLEVVKVVGWFMGWLDVWIWYWYFNWDIIFIMLNIVYICDDICMMVEKVYLYFNFVVIGIWGCYKES